MKLPDINDRSGIWDFAMSYEAYERHGSFEAVAKIAQRASRSSLDECLTELYFRARASRHLGDHNYVKAYRELKPFIERYMNEAADKQS